MATATWAPAYIMLAWRNASRSVYERSYLSSVYLWLTAGCVGPGAVARYGEIFECFPKYLFTEEVRPQKS